MTDHYPFEENKNKDATNELAKVKEEYKKVNQELASANS